MGGRSLSGPVVSRLASLSCRAFILAYYRERGREGWRIKIEKFCQINVLSKSTKSYEMWMLVQNETSELMCRLFSLTFSASVPCIRTNRARERGMGGGKTIASNACGVIFELESRFCFRLLVWTRIQRQRAQSLTPVRSQYLKIMSSLLPQNRFSLV